MSLTSVLGIVAVCVVLRCGAWPKIGETANSDRDCWNQFGKKICNILGDYTCAKLHGVYVSKTSDTMCQFCKVYGRTDAIVNHVGEEQRCADLEPGYPVTDDPECTQIHTTPPHCLNNGPHLCATLDGNTDVVIHARNKCVFCQKYGGHSHYIFYGTGTKCAEISPYVKTILKSQGLL